MAELAEPVMADPAEPAPAILKPRAYQLEMLEDSLQRNIIVAMDTGSGKTNIAVLRIKEELERNGLDKRVWFLTPTVSLATQQAHVLSTQLPSFPVRLLSGASGVDTWSTQTIWDQVLHNIAIVVCTHQVLLDALIHGFVATSSISLLVFDEAHHAQAAHPANRIMQRFYHARDDEMGDRPKILGLTASPVFGRRGGGLEQIEQNLHAIARTPKLHREELLRHVHLPTLIPLLYSPYQHQYHPAVQGITEMYEHLQNNLGSDPYVIQLRADGHGVESKRGKKALAGKTFCIEQAKRLATVAWDVHAEMGGWAAGYYLKLCIGKFMRRQAEEVDMGDDLARKEKAYLAQSFERWVPLADVPDVPGPGELSQKVELLVQTLAKEMRPGAAGIVFVKTRASVRLLCHILETDARTRDVLRIGTFVGTSNYAGRAANVSELVDAKGQETVLDDLRTGVKNLVISTSVCEEGIDISACNVVVCFERPPNLKSFVQRRGRARSTESRYLIMLAEGERGLLDEWMGLERVMKELYMDDMRVLEQIEEAEKKEEGSREFVVQATGAKLYLDDAVRHLYHFCNKLPTNGYVAPEPVFTFEEDEMERMRCRVLLPNSIDAEAREWHSRDSWETEKMARNDAAFEAYVGLYRADLVNDNLMPMEWVDEEVERVLGQLQKRENIIQVDGERDGLRGLAERWGKIGEEKICGQEEVALFANECLLLDSRGEETKMSLYVPMDLLKAPELKLFVDVDKTSRFRVLRAIKLDRSFDKEGANKVSYLVLRSTLWTRMDKNQKLTPILCLPTYATEDFDGWYTELSGTVGFDQLTPDELNSQSGLVQDPGAIGKKFLYNGEWEYDYPPEEAGVIMKPTIMLRVKSLPKKRNFLSPWDVGASSKGQTFDLLSSNTCILERVPVQYTELSVFFPSILKHLSDFLIARTLCDTILHPVSFTDIGLVLNAITASSANREYDYQRLEFLGDSLLKYQTSLTLISGKPRWHEGILSRAKDHIVSNGNLAVATQKRGLAQFILTKAFTYLKWRMPYNEELLRKEDPKPREVSTKILADVIESLIGAAYLDGGETMALRCLTTLLPDVKWLPSAECYAKLSEKAVSMDEETLPDRYQPLEDLIGRNFTHKALLLESITHSSYPSASKISSYQRLEYLGDAILDIIVTKVIFNHHTSISVSKMHLLRTTTVNANFLAFFALSHATFIEIAKIEPPSPGKEPAVHATVKSLTLPKFLRAAPIPQLTASLQKTYSRFWALRASIEDQLCYGSEYPWVDLAALGAEKLVSDLVESTIGAIAIDAGGDLSACEDWLGRLEILPWLRSALERDIDLMHPKQALGHAAVTDSVEYKTVAVKDKPDNEDEERTKSLEGVHYECTVLVAKKEMAYAEGLSRVEAETRAAHTALWRLRAEKEQGMAVEDKDSEDSDTEMFYDAHE